jgi:hypothetical protein
MLKQILQEERKRIGQNLISNKEGIHESKVFYFSYS